MIKKKIIMIAVLGLILSPCALAEPMKAKVVEFNPQARQLSVHFLNQTTGKTQNLDIQLAENVALKGITSPQQLIAGDEVILEVETGSEGGLETSLIEVMSLPANA